jgi:glycerol-3-phosphate responsive antiterminator
LYYHTEIAGKKDRNYHLNKTKQLNNVGYRLIHIFEDEWISKKEIIKSKLQHIFQLTTNDSIIHARKCIIKYVDNNDKKTFLNTNHIQGVSNNSNITVGAYYKDEIVAIMCFDEKRKMNGKNDKSVVELSRFATKNRFILTGIASRLLKFFIKKHNPTKIISFADRRWTLDMNDNLYTKLGFQLEKILKADYTYFNSKVGRYKRLHKFGFGKKALKKKFPDIYNDSKTEWQIMKEYGIVENSNMN